jgi:hypothetical protein
MCRAAPGSGTSVHQHSPGSVSRRGQYRARATEVRAAGRPTARSFRPWGDPFGQTCGGCRPSASAVRACAEETPRTTGVDTRRAGLRQSLFRRSRICSRLRAGKTGLRPCQVPASLPIQAPSPRVGNQARPEPHRRTTRLQPESSRHFPDGVFPSVPPSRRTAREDTAEGGLPSSRSGRPPPRDGGGRPDRGPRCGSSVRKRVGCGAEWVRTPGRGGVRSR